jgi:hypothetical protein
MCEHLTIYEYAHIQMISILMITISIKIVIKVTYCSVFLKSIQVLF